MPQEKMYSKITIAEAWDLVLVEYDSMCDSGKGTKTGFTRTKSTSKRDKNINGNIIDVSYNRWGQ